MRISSQFITLLRATDYRRGHFSPCFWLLTLTSFVFLSTFFSHSIAQSIPCSSNDSATSQPCESHDFASQFSLNQKSNAPTDPSADPTNQSNSGNAMKNDAQYGDTSLPRDARATFRDSRDPEVQEISEFQRFVSATTGTMLPNYGSALFASQAARFASFEHAAAPEDFIISTDDELRIHIWGQINFSANLHVSREGEIYLPKIGEVHVAGLTFAAAKDQIREAIGRVYRNFECSVDLGEIHTIRIYVTGQARRPGQYTIGGLGTLVEAIFLSAGPATSGSMRHVQ
jgi:protein involved in polysaccharide export with SLBB domain